MNQEEIIRALNACSEEGAACYRDCPLSKENLCKDKLLNESRKLILSLLEKPAVDARQEPEPWTRKRVLSEAERCVCGQREQDYGTPEDSFNIIADLWAVYLKGCGVSIDFLDSHDVAAMMALLKIARISENPQHMDSWVDLAGYAACGATCGEHYDDWNEEDLLYKK